jgi:hypothetical protein
MVSVIVSLLPALMLAATHVILNFWEIRIENKDGWHWLSICSGISAAYVFLGLIPDIYRYKTTLEQETSVESLFNHRFYALLILIGFSIFYSVESLVKSHRKRKTKDVGIIDDPKGTVAKILTVLDEETLQAVDAEIQITDTEGEEEDNAEKQAEKQLENMEAVQPAQLLPCTVRYIFVLSVFLFSMYGAVIAFLLPQKLAHFGWVNMVFYYMAMQAHYVIDDMNLHEHFGQRYDKYGRIPLICGTVAGFLFGVIFTGTIVLTACSASFIAGATILNVLNAELPSDSKTSVPLFLFGAVLYSILIIFLYKS